MTLKKKDFSDREVPIFDEALVYERSGHWQFRMYLRTEKKYVVKSLETSNRSRAIELGKKKYFEIQACLDSGKKYFSLTTKECVERYLERRQMDVKSEAIVPGRLGTIRTHLLNWLEYIDKDTKIKELARDNCDGYYEFRKKAGAKQVTIQNEQSTINACLKYHFKNGDCAIDGFSFPRMPRMDNESGLSRDKVLSNDEYERLVAAAKTYTAKKNKVSEEEWLERILIRHWVLIAANTGMRVGEQRQLRWSDVEILDTKIEGKPETFVYLRIRAETSKRRKSREVICRGGQHFNRLKTETKSQGANRLIFSIDGDTEFSEKKLLEHFNKLLELAMIENYKERRIVPYSLRHFMITQRMKAGLRYQEIAAMVGNSATEVERTYIRFDDSTKLTNAAASFRTLKDGTIQRY